MFHVICINAKLNSDEFPYENFKLVEGEIYTVMGERMGFNCFKKCVGFGYDLKEDGKYLWDKKKFIPLSEIDETELLKERHYETLTNESTF